MAGCGWPVMDIPYFLLVWTPVYDVSKLFLSLIVVRAWCWEHNQK